MYNVQIRMYKLHREGAIDLRGAFPLVFPFLPLGPKPPKR